MDLKGINMTTILTTTGISLYDNTRRKHNWAPSASDEQMLEYLYNDPVSASAEANSLLQIARSEDTIILLHTDTPVAERCANLVRNFFITKQGFQSYQVRTRKLQLRDNEEHIENHGLRNLVSSIATEIDALLNNNQDVVINATPGFKLEVIYSTMIGMLYRVPIKYMHEKFRRVVTLNPVALDWDMSLFVNEKKLLEWLSEPRAQREIEARLKGTNERERIETLLTSPDSNGNMALSPLGEMLLLMFMYEEEEARKAEWPAEVKVKNIEDKIASAVTQHGHDYPKETKDICKKIAQIPYVQIIISEHFASVQRSHIAHFYANGSIILYWTNKGKAARLKIQTTAEGRPQTLKIVWEIQKLLES
jgi:putative CRISPR-associated protein (TIGR02619 family)